MVALILFVSVCRCMFAMFVVDLFWLLVCECGGLCMLVFICYVIALCLWCFVMCSCMLLYVCYVCVFVDCFVCVFCLWLYVWFV